MPQTPVMPPPTNRTSDADLWEYMVRQGVPKDVATQSIRIRQQQHRAAEAATAPEPEPLLGVDALRTAGQGALLGFGDEIVGGIRGALDPNRTVSEAIDEEREGVRRYGEAHPVAAPVAELGGMVAAGGLTGIGRGIVGRMAAPLAETAGAGKIVGGLARLLAPAKEGAAAVSTGRKIAQGAKFGAAAGGISAAGQAEGGVMDRLPDAAAGTVIGGVLGAALPLAGHVGSRTVESFRPTSEVTAPGQVAKAVSRATRGIVHVKNSGERAKDLLVDAAGRRGVSAEGLLEEAAKLPADKPYSLLDVLGEPGQRLARGAVTIPSRASETLPKALLRRQADEAAGQQARIVSGMSRRLGVEAGENAEQTARELVTAQHEAAQPLYRNVYGRTVDIPAFNAIADHPVLGKYFRAAYARGREIAAGQDVDLPRWFETTVRNGERVREFNDVPVQALDYMKQGLDDVIGGRMRGGKMDRKLARSLRQKLNSALSAVDSHLPEYGQARAQYAHDAAVQSAFDLGRNDFMKEDIGRLQSAVARMGGAERELFKRGAFANLQANIGATSLEDDVTKRLATVPRVKARLRLLFGPQAEPEFEDLVQERGLYNAKRFVLGGSNTADKQADRELLRRVPLRSLLKPTELIGLLSDEGMTSLRDAQARATADVLGEKLGAGFSSRDDLLRALEELAAHAKAQAARAARQRAARQAATKAGALATGAALGGP